MKRNTCPTPTSFADLAAKSKMSLSSTERTHEPPEAGHGTAIALNVVALPAETMGPHPRRHETPGFGNGGRTIPRQLRVLMPSATSSKNTGWPPRKSRPCVICRAVGAQSASGKPVASSWTTATLKATSERCFARPVTPSSAGMSARLTLCSSSNAMWKSTAAKPGTPCHADVLMEMANA